MNAAAIAARLGNHRQEGAYWRCRCPVHGGTSLTLGNSPKGRLFIRCWYGCRRSAVVAALVQRGLITKDMAKVTPETPEQKAQRAATEAARRAYRIACARDLWQQSHPAAGSIVETYLWSRLLTAPLPSVIRLIGRQRHRESGGDWPAMIARVDHVEHGLVAVHMTYLNPFDPARRVDLDPRKRCVGPIKGAAVQLAPAASRMAVSEGIENGVAVMIGWEMPCWAALSANAIADLVLPPVESGLGCDIVIAADADAPGLIGARRAGGGRPQRPNCYAGPRCRFRFQRSFDRFVIGGGHACHKYAGRIGEGRGSRRRRRQRGSVGAGFLAPPRRRTALLRIVG